MPGYHQGQVSSHRLRAQRKRRRKIAAESSQGEGKSRASSPAPEQAKTGTGPVAEVQATHNRLVEKEQPWAADEHPFVNEGQQPMRDRPTANEGPQSTPDRPITDKGPQSAPEGPIAREPSRPARGRPFSKAEAQPTHNRPWQEQRRSSHIPNQMRREVFERDDGRCTFVGTDGHRCSERGFLELHHDKAFAQGGESDATNVRLVCRAHNGHLAERDFGAVHIEARRTSKTASARALRETERLSRSALDRAPQDARHT